jgi:hypothetical protein
MIKLIKFDDVDFVLTRSIHSENKLTRQLLSQCRFHRNLFRVSNDEFCFKHGISSRI